MRSGGLTGVLCVGLGCATGGAPSDAGPGGRAPSGFPEPETLYELRERPSAPGSPFGEGYRDVSAWDLAGPFPEVVQAAPRDGDRPWDPLLDDLVRSRDGLAVASEAMACVAREAGRFLVEHGALPGLGLQHFLAGRCAVTTEAPSFVTLRWEFPRSLGLAEAIDELGGSISDALRSHAVGGLVDIGMWLHSATGRVDLVISKGERVVRLDPVETLAGPGGRVVVGGEMLRSASGVGAVVTRGRFGWAACEAREDVGPPRFDFVCHVDESDPTAWISVFYERPGSILMQSGAQLLIRGAGNPATRYRRHRYAESRPVTGGEPISAAFVELVNQVRAEAGAPPLVLAAEQSRVAREVAPRYFAALGDPEAGAIVAELVALGLMAGWEIGDIVQGGRFVSTWLVEESNDLASLLSDLLELPEARMTLLEPELEQIAVGPHVDLEAEPAVLGVIAATYRLFSEEEHRRNASLVSGRLSRARAERGRAPPRTLEAALPLTVAAASRVEAGAPPRDVLPDLIQEGVDALGRSVMGWVAEARDLDDIVFPDEFLERSELEVAISVSTHRPEGEPWGRYVVLMLAAEPDRRRL